jgi:hypothetical protein
MTEMTDTSTSPAATFRFGQVVPRTPSTPTLGPLAAFSDPVTGEGLTFHGRGFNTIFRPNLGSPAVLPVTPTDGPPFNDNILELNLTEETLTFGKPLGLVPNRGEVQPDAFLNGIPYQQVINDVTDHFLNPHAEPTGIHFEPGLWMNMPATTDPDEVTTVFRMASIPHGTTICAQGTAAPPFPGPPPFTEGIDITPTTKDPAGQTISVRFPSQGVTTAGTFRIPQDLTELNAAGVITQPILDNPILILKNAIAGQTITETTVLTISTSPAGPLFGGGADNIAFLLGDDAVARPNAQTVQMTATFWIETVQHEITVPVFTPGQPPVILSPNVADRYAPRFRVDPPISITAPVTVTVTSTQIQYAQTVILNFNNLLWPHVSVATLTPDHVVSIPAETWAAHR